MAYFSPLLPVIIDEPGTYETRCGEKVEIFRIVSGVVFACQGGYAKDGTFDGWHKSGRLYYGIECDNDIVKKVASHV